MDRGVWRAIVQGVPKRWTQLSNWAHTQNLGILNFQGGAGPLGASQEALGPFGRHRRCWFDPWIGKISWRRIFSSWRRRLLEANRPPAPVFLLGDSHGQRNLEGYSPWGHKESYMTEYTPPPQLRRVRIGSGRWQSCMQGIWLNQFWSTSGV